MQREVGPVRITWPAYGSALCYTFLLASVALFLLILGRPSSGVALVGAVYFLRQARKRGFRSTRRACT